MEKKFEQKIEVPFIPYQCEVHENKEQPKYLYHGGSGDIENEINPKKLRCRDDNEGELVFATPDVAFAATFMSPRPSDMWSARGRRNGAYYLVVGDRDKFEREDKGGTIYAFDAEGFDCDETKGMRRCEWHSEKAVCPIASKKYESTLDAMLENGVQVYFVDMDLLREIKRAEDHGMSILKGLKSENEKRGMNFIDVFVK